MSILKFYSKTCNPCKTVASLIEKNGINVKSVNIDEDYELVEKFRITSVPTLIKIDDSEKEIARQVGFRGEKELINFVTC